jgi:hypothetical protein
MNIILDTDLHLEFSHTYLPTYLLTELSPSWEATNCAAAQELPAFYGTRRFITVFTRGLHWSLSWAGSMQSIPSHTISLRYILILSTHLRLGLPSGLFPSGFPTNIRVFKHNFSKIESLSVTNFKGVWVCTQLSPVENTVASIVGLRRKVSTLQ